MRKKIAAAAAFLATLFLGAGAFRTVAGNIPQSALVKVLRVPNGGIQPQAATDASGVVHMVYFSGDPLRGDLNYTRSVDSGNTFSSPIRVNSQPGSAVAVGNIRGARLAVGRNGEIHVAWNGSSSAEPKTTDGKAPMLYSRLQAASHTFEEQRNLIHSASGIDGGGALAADDSGNVYVFWHAPVSGGKNESDRRIWVSQSSDDGKTFSKETVAFAQETGVCGCCGMSAFADSRGVLFALFRSASEMVNRDMYLLVSNNHARSFQGTNVSKWNVGYCVMSSEAFAESASGVLAAWETEKQVLYARVDPNTRTMEPPMVAPGFGVNRKYPALTANRNGFALLGWTEETGWKKGGTAAWQVLDKSGRPLGEIGRSPGVPVWGLVAAFTARDGSFRVVY